MGKLTLTTFEAPTVENPYIDAIAEVAKSADPNAAFKLEIDAKDFYKERNFVAKAAHAANKTARLVLKDESNVKIVPAKGDDEKPTVTGTMVLTYRLTEKHKPRRGASAESAEAPETSEADAAE